MATVRVSKEIISKVEEKIDSLYASRKNEVRKMFPDPPSGDAMYQQALAAIGITEEIFNGIPQRFLRTSGEIYGALFADESEIGTPSCGVSMSLAFGKNAAGEQIRKPMPDAWASSYRTELKAVYPEYVAALRAAKQADASLREDIRTAQRKIVNLMEECGSVNKFIKVYPDGRALIPSWALEKVDEVVVRSKATKVSDEERKAKADALTDAMGEVIAIGVLDGVI